MKHIHTFESFLNEENIFEGMSFTEIKDKYLENPYGIGANSIEYVEGKNGNPAMLIFRDEDKRGRDDIESKLKSMGVPAKKLSKSTADKAYKYRYELTMYESALNEASFTDNMDDATKAVYREYTQMIPDKIKTHDALKSALDKDPNVKQLKSDRTLRTALAWALTYAQEMER